MTGEKTGPPKTGGGFILGHRRQACRAATWARRARWLRELHIKNKDGKAAGFYTNRNLSGAVKTSAPTRDPDKIKDWVCMHATADASWKALLAQVAKQPTPDSWPNISGGNSRRRGMDSCPSEEDSSIANLGPGAKSGFFPSET